MVASTKGPVVARMVALVLLLSVAAISQTISTSALHDEQIWGHLRAGTWILEQKTWPQTGLFSQAANLHWRDFTWGWDVLTALSHRVLRLRALPALSVSFSFLLAVVAFALAGGLRGHFWTAAGLSAVAQYVLAGMGPWPTCVSVALFGIELGLILESRRTGNLRFVYVLPVLFLFWTNQDLGFVYGIALYAFFVLGMRVEQTNWFEACRAQISVGKLGLLGAACILATVISPYGYHGYVAFFAQQFGSVNEYLTPYKAMSFHRPQEYFLLLLVMAAFLTLGLRRSRDPFLLPSLIGASVLAFHGQGEGWLIVMVSLGVLGETIVSPNTSVIETFTSEWKQQVFAASLAVVLICLAFLRIPSAPDQLFAKVAESNPVAAADYVRQHNLPPPLFNAYRWGGFLSWYLPEYPVVIDGRRGLYSTEHETRYLQVMKVELPYQTFEPMVRARTLLMDKSDVMADALRDAPGFQVAYEDRIAIVLLHAAKE